MSTSMIETLNAVGVRTGWSDVASVRSPDLGRRMKRLCARCIGCRTDRVHRRRMRHRATGRARHPSATPRRPPAIRRAEPGDAAHLVGPDPRSGDAAAASTRDLPREHREFRAPLPLHRSAGSSDLAPSASEPMPGSGKGRRNRYETPTTPVGGRRSALTRRLATRAAR